MQCNTGLHCVFSRQNPRVSFVIWIPHWINNHSWENDSFHVASKFLTFEHTALQYHVTEVETIVFFAVPSTGAQWHGTESPRGSARQHDPPQPPPPSPSPPSCRTSWCVWGLRLLEPTSPGDTKSSVCVEINNRPLAFLSALCCHQWKATAKVEHQT